MSRRWKPKYASDSERRRTDVRDFVDAPDNIVRPECANGSRFRQEYFIWTQLGGLIMDRKHRSKFRINARQGFIDEAPINDGVDRATVKTGYGLDGTVAETSDPCAKDLGRCYCWNRLAAGWCKRSFHPKNLLGSGNPVIVCLKVFCELECDDQCGQSRCQGKEVSKSDCQIFFEGCPQKHVCHCSIATRIKETKGLTKGWQENILMLDSTPVRVKDFCDEWMSDLLECPSMAASKA